MSTLVQQNPAWPVARLCRLFAVPRSSHYYTPAPRQEADLCRSIELVAGQWTCYGVRRMTHQLRREQLADEPLGHRRVYRLMREMGLCAKAPRPRKKRTTNSDHTFARYTNRVKGLVIDHADQVWVSDITYVQLGSGFVYLAVIMDVFTRSIRGWFLSRSLNSGLCEAALRKALSVGQPQIHHSDQGVQYASDSYTNLLKQHGATISMAAVGCPEDNGYAERLMRTIKEEHVRLTEYTDFADAKSQIGEFLEDVYQRKRIHSALGYLTPAEFANQNRQAVK